MKNIIRGIKEIVKFVIAIIWSAIKDTVLAAGIVTVGFALWGNPLTLTLNMVAKVFASSVVINTIASLIVKAAKAFLSKKCADVFDAFEEVTPEDADLSRRAVQEMFENMIRQQDIQTATNPEMI